MSSSDAPEDEHAAAPRRSPPAGTPLILQVSPLDPASGDQDEFYYDPFADLELGDFAAARAFFVSHGHAVVFHDCPDPQAFQDLFPQATIEYLSSLPDGLLAEGHKILNSQREAYRQQVVRPSAITPPHSIVARYVAAGFGGGGDGGPSPPTTTASSFSSSTRSGLLRYPSASRGRDPQSPSVNALRESSTVPEPPRRSASLRPDPEGDDIPAGYFHGGSRSAYGGTSTRYGGFSSSVASRQGPYIPRDIPPFIFQCLERDRVPPTSTLVASTLGDPVPPLGSLSSADVLAPSPSDITMSFSDVLASSQGAPPVSVLGRSPVNASLVHGGFPPSVLVAFPHPTVFLGVPPAPSVAVVPAVVPPPAPAVIPPPAPAAVLPLVPSRPIRAELLKLDPMKDLKAFLDSLEQIQYYLQMPDFCTGCTDDSLVTDASNQKASRVWEGELRITIKEGTLRFLFENKGTQYHGRGFEMLAALMQHCRPDTVTNAFSSLLSLFNDVQGENESILEYRSRFDGLTLELNQCRVIIPPLLMILLFVRALHSRYECIVKQFRSRSKNNETATLDSIVADAVFNDGFIQVDKKGKPASGPCAPAAASANTNTDSQGKVWRNPFECGICPICHKDELPHHVPAQCPLLAELNLKLTQCHPAKPQGPAPAPTPQGPAPAPTPAPAPRAVAADGGGSLVPPSGLTAVVAPSPAPEEDFDTDDEFRWDGYDYGAEYSSTPKVNHSIHPYTPSCSHFSVPLAPPSVPLPPKPPRMSAALQILLKSLSKSLVVPHLRHGRLAVADTGATDHMIPDKSCFISYKSIAGLSVRMGNNLFVPVLGRSTAVFALNGK